MKIYELRAFIGRTRIQYFRLFATLAAAKNHYNRLKEQNPNIQFDCIIYELIQQQDEFKLSTEYYM